MILFRWSNIMAREQYSVYEWNAESREAVISGTTTTYDREGARYILGLEGFSNCERLI